MTNGFSQPLVRRVLTEYRSLVIPLAVVLLLNVLVYGFFVYPLSQRVSTVTERTQAADADLAAARVEHTRASAMLTGKARASEELQTFYEKVLPLTLAGARRLVVPRLEELARSADLEPVRTTSDPEVDRDRTLTRYKIRMTLEGSYQGIRRFIHQLEQAPEFVVIDEVSLQEETGEEGVLGLRLDLSTYFKGAAE